jgi:hypothetical protein
MSETKPEANQVPTGMRHYREFPAVAIDAIITDHFRTIEDIAYVLDDKPKYIQKILDGKATPNMQKIKNILYIRPRTLKAMSRNYWVFEDDVNGVPTGGCTLHDYLTIHMPKLKKNAKGQDPEAEPKPKKEPKVKEDRYDRIERGLTKNNLRIGVIYMEDTLRNTKSIISVVLGETSDLLGGLPQPATPQAISVKMDTYYSAEQIRKLVFDNGIHILHTIINLANFKC